MAELVKISRKQLENKITHSNHNVTYTMEQKGRTPDKPMFGGVESEATVSGDVEEGLEYFKKVTGTKQCNFWVMDCEHTNEEYHTTADGILELYCEDCGDRLERYTKEETEKLTK